MNEWGDSADMDDIFGKLSEIADKLTEICGKMPDLQHTEISGENAKAPRAGDTGGRCYTNRQFAHDILNNLECVCGGLLEAYDSVCPACGKQVIFYQREP